LDVYGSAAADRGMLPNSGKTWMRSNGKDNPHANTAISRKAYRGTAHISFSVISMRRPRAKNAPKVTIPPAEANKNCPAGRTAALAVSGGPALNQYPFPGQMGHNANTIPILA
jgi:hypothetical protein